MKIFYILEVIFAHLGKSHFMPSHLVSRSGFTVWTTYRHERNFS